jgi:hypothetical protein
MGDRTKHEIIQAEQTEKDKEAAKLALVALQGSGEDAKPKEIEEPEPEEYSAILNKVLLAVVWSYGAAMK